MRLVKHNYLKEFENVLNKIVVNNKVEDNDLIDENDSLLKLFYDVDENGTITNETELSYIIDSAQMFDMDYRSIYDLITGKMDTNFIHLLEAKLGIDEFVSTLPTKNENKNNKTKKKNNNMKVIPFKKDQKDND